jgi:hypothetical protein
MWNIYGQAEHSTTLPYSPYSVVSAGGAGGVGQWLAEQRDDGAISDRVVGSQLLTIFFSITMEQRVGTCEGCAGSALSDSNH